MKRFLLITLRNSLLLLNQKFHYCVHESLPVAPTVSQFSSVKVLEPCLSTIYFNIVLPYTPMSCKWTLLSYFVTKFVYALITFTMRYVYPAHLSLSYLITLKVSREECKIRIFSHVFYLQFRAWHSVVK